MVERQAAAAVTLELTDDEAEQLRMQAEAELRSVPDVARTAIREYLARHGHGARLVASLDELAPRYADLLDRLGRPRSAG